MFSKKLLWLILTKAFDTVDNNKKFNRIGLCAQIESLLKDYLSDKEFVFPGFQKSSLKRIEYGVRHGSVLSTHLFSIYINDLPETCTKFEDGSFC